MSIKRIVATGVAAALLPVMLAGPAFAGNAHFIKSQTRISASGFSLTATFKEAGLAAGSVETITLSASYVAVFQCINGGGKNPSAANKSEESGNASASGNFSADRNGNVTGSLTLNAPSTETNSLSCPGGQREQLSTITWSNVSLNDSTSGARMSFPGSYSYGTLVA